MKIYCYVCNKHTEAATQRLSKEKVFWKGVLLQSNFIEITLRQGCSPVNLLNIFRTPFLKNISGWLLLNIENLYTLKYNIFFLKKH